VKIENSSPVGEKLQAKNCFVCGCDNKLGLNAPFYFNGKTVEARFTPGDHLSGFEKSFMAESFLHLAMKP
jgi:hypothetical protein